MGDTNVTLEYERVDIVLYDAWIKQKYLFTLSRKKCKDNGSNSIVWARPWQRGEGDHIDWTSAQVTFEDDEEQKEKMKESTNNGYGNHSITIIWLL